MKKFLKNSMDTSTRFWNTLPKQIPQKPDFNGGQARPTGKPNSNVEVLVGRPMTVGRDQPKSRGKCSVDLPILVYEVSVDS